MRRNTADTVRGSGTVSVGGVNYDWNRSATGVYRCRLPLPGRDGRSGVGNAETLLIDCGTTFPKRNRSPLTSGTHRVVLSRLVMTHHHSTTFWAGGWFRSGYAAPPVAAARCLTDCRRLRRGRPGTARTPMRSARPPGARARPPDLAGRYRPGGRGIRGRARAWPRPRLVRLIHRMGTPAVVFCGDLVEQSADPAIGPDANPAAWPAALDRLLDLGGEDAIYVPITAPSSTPRSSAASDPGWRRGRVVPTQPVVQHPIEHVDEVGRLG